MKTREVIGVAEQCARLQAIVMRYQMTRPLSAFGRQRSMLSRPDCPTG